MTDPSIVIKKRIKSDLSPYTKDCKYDFVPEMERYKGRIVTLQREVGSFCYFENVDYRWHKEMLEDVTPTLEKTMVNLSFDTIPTPAEFHKDGKWPVVVTIEGNVYGLDFTEESENYLDILTSEPMPRPVTKDDRIYLFTNSSDIGKTLIREGCLDKFLYRPTTKLDIETIKGWMKEYKFVGHHFKENSFSRPEKRRCVLKDSFVATVNRFGGQGNYSIASELGRLYVDFVGFNNEYEFFAWLMT